MNRNELFQQKTFFLPNVTYLDTYAVESRFMRKKQKEFLALYEPIHMDFERFFRARVYGDMEFRDLMNETLLKAFEKFDELRSKKAFLSYLF